MLDEISGLLKFDRDKESRRDVSALVVDARRVRDATSDLAGPERKPAGVRLAIEKIYVMLTHKEGRLVDRIGGVNGFLFAPAVSA